MALVDDYAQAVWEAETRELTVGGSGAEPTTAAEVFAEAVWEALSRTLTGGAVYRRRIIISS